MRDLHTRGRRSASQGAGERGFTLTEILVSLVVFTLIAGSAFAVLHHSSQSKRVGDQLAEAQQNGRSAMNAIINDLRLAGYGIDRNAVIPIEVASDFRMTLIIDQDRDGLVEDGERVTYFVDPNQSQSPISDTQNPYDYVLRRVVSTAGDSLAVPGSGKGNAVAYLVTQRASNSSTSKDVPLFSYFDDAGATLAGTATDPAGASYGNTLPASYLGTPGGADPEIARIQVRIVTETAAPRSGTTAEYRRFELGSTVRPRNFGFDLVSSYTVADSTGGGGDPADTTDAPPDTGGAPPDTSDPELPEYEPPIRISTSRVLSMVVGDLSELDSQEGSDTAVDGQYDADIILGTKAGSVNNMSVWFNGQPDKYPGERLYDNTPNYYGNSPYDIQGIAYGDLVSAGYGENDVVAAVRVSDTSGGFQTWLNQWAMDPGRIGTGVSTTTPDAYYSNSSGQGNAIVLIDVDQDGDLDVVLGTRTGANAGKVEIWHNDSMGNFTFDESFAASGEVLCLTAVDWNNDGWMEFAAGTVSHSNDKTGQVNLFVNQTGAVSMAGQFNANGRVNAISAADLTGDGLPDLVTGLKTGNNSGKVQVWKNAGTGFVWADEAVADGVVLSVATGLIDIGNNYPDVVAGNADHTIQAWFSDPNDGFDVLPTFESWADANAGGEVHAIGIAKLEEGAPNAGSDVLYDIVAGTAISATEGEIVIYLNPYVWTLTP